MGKGRIVSLNLLSLVGALVLLSAFLLLALLQFDRDAAYNLMCAGWILLPIGLLYVGIVIRILALDIRFLRDNPEASRKFSVIFIVVPLALTAITCSISPVAYLKLERWVFIQSLSKDTPLKSEISDLCTQLFRDPDYILLVPLGVGSSYYKIAGNDHVSIHPDESGDAYWFDYADSLSTFGYVCTRPGVAVEDAITNYEFWVTKRNLIKVFENFYWWN